MTITRTGTASLSFGASVSGTRTASVSGTVSVWRGLSASATR
jgi:hypothetical protein